MRIGIDARLTGYRDGGISEYTRRLIEALALLDQTETDHYLILDAARPAISGIFRTPLMPTGGPGRFLRVPVFTPCHHRLERWTLALEIARLRLDLLHSPDFIPPMFGARHTVITVHDLNFIHYPQFQTADSLRYYSGQIRQAVLQAKHIFADSQATKDDLVNLLNVVPDKITVHMLGVNPAFQPLSPAVVQETKTRLGLPSSYLLFVGTFEPRKNLPGLLDAYAQLRAELADAPPLVIVGRRGWLYEAAFQKMADLNLEPHLIWLEELPLSDLPAVYNGASLLTAPSFYEGFGLTALEAMACGVPTVVANRGSLPEVVGDSGLLIDPDRQGDLAAALHRMLVDSALRKKSAAAGLARAATFTWQNTAQVVLSVYRQITGC